MGPTNEWRQSQHRSIDEDSAQERKECEEFYADLRLRGLEYGPSYQPVLRVRSQNGLAEAELKRPEGAPDRCLLDGCLQVVGAALPPGAARAQLRRPAVVSEAARKVGQNGRLVLLEGGTQRIAERLSQQAARDATPKVHTRQGPGCWWS